jgi:hypothetical protein
LPTALTVKAGLTAAGGRRWICMARAHEISLTAERLGGSADSQQAEMRSRRAALTGAAE